MKFRVLIPAAAAIMMVAAPAMAASNTHKASHAKVVKTTKTTKIAKAK